MRPDGLRVMLIGLTITGIDHIHLIHLTVFVPVIVIEFYLLIDSINGLNNQFSRVLVVGTDSIFYVTSIVGKFILGRVGTHHIEYDIELTIALLAEKVSDTAIDQHAVYILEPFLVGDIVPEVMNIEGLTVTILVVEL